MAKNNKTSNPSLPPTGGAGEGPGEGREALRSEELKALHLSGVEGICIDTIQSRYITSMQDDLMDYYAAMARAKKPMAEAAKLLDVIRTKASALSKDGRAYLYTDVPEDYKRKKILFTPGGLLLDICRERSTRRLDVSRLRAEHPDIYEEYSVSGTSAAPLRMASQMLHIIDNVKCKM